MPFDPSQPFTIEDQQETPEPPSGKEVLLSDANNPPVLPPALYTKQAYREGANPAILAGAMGYDALKNGGSIVRDAVKGIYSAATSPVSGTMDNLRKGFNYMTGDTLPSPNIDTGEIPRSAIAGMIQPPASSDAGPAQIPNPQSAAPNQSTPASPNPNPASDQPKVTGNPQKDFGLDLRSIIANNIQPPTPATPQQAPQMGQFTPALWNDLPDWRRAQILQKYPDQPNVSQMYNQAVMAQAGPSVIPATSDAMMAAASRGGLPEHPGSTIDMTQAAQNVNRVFGGMYSGAGGGIGMTQTLSDSQGIPYAKIMPIFNPATGSMEMKQVDIPADARNTVAGLPQGALKDMTDLGDKFASLELPKTFYGQIAPKYQSIVNLINSAEKTGDYNQFRSMDVLNSYAGITRPGSVVRDSTIATDLEGSGLPNEVARHWESFVKGQGILSKKDLSQIRDAAKDSYEGYHQQIELAKRPVLIQAHLRTGIAPEQLNKIMFPPSPGDEGTEQGQPQSLTSQDLQAAKAWLQQNPNDPKAAAVAAKIQQSGG